MELADRNGNKGDRVFEHAQEAMFTDEQVWLWEAYAHYGGLVSLHKLIEQLSAPHNATLLHHLGCLYRSNLLINFAAAGEIWLPKCQFTANGGPRVAVREVLWELRSDFSPMESALWFCNANKDLAYRAPVEVIHEDQDAVLCAAQKAVLNKLTEMNSSRRPIRFIRPSAMARSSANREKKPNTTAKLNNLHSSQRVGIIYNH